MPVLILSRDDDHWKLRRFDLARQQWAVLPTDVSASVAANEALRRIAVANPGDLVAVTAPGQPAERSA